MTMKINLIPIDDISGVKNYMDMAFMSMLKDVASSGETLTQLKDVFEDEKIIKLDIDKRTVRMLMFPRYELP